MLQDSLRHRVDLIKREERAGRAAGKAWLGAGVKAISAVRELWPNTGISSQEQGRLAREIGNAALWGMAGVVQGAQDDLTTLIEQEQAWAMGLLEKDIPNEVWDFVGGPWPAGTRTREELVTPVDDRVARDVLDTPLAGMPWQERFELLSLEQQTRLRRAIAAGMAEAESIPQITRRLKAAFSWGATRAAKIARTEVHHASNEIHRRVYEENKQVLNGLEYAATLDERVCMECGGYDGNAYYYDPGPGQASIDDLPYIPIHSNCRCVHVPITKWAEMIGLVSPAMSTRASMDGPVPATQKFPAWLRQQPAAVQDTVLGSHVRGLEWRKGGMKALPRRGRPVAA